MQRDVEQDCVDCAAEALTRFNEQRSVAQYIKSELDRKYSSEHASTFHVIVGHQFGSFVTHDERFHLYFFIRDIGFLIWRTENASISPSMVGRVPGVVVAESSAAEEMNPASAAQKSMMAAAMAQVAAEEARKLQQQEAAPSK
jgi:dynein light chain LC8-type